MKQVKNKKILHKIQNTILRNKTRSFFLGGKNMQEEIEMITPTEDQGDTTTQAPVDGVVDVATFLALVQREDARPSEHGLGDFLSILR